MSSSYFSRSYYYFLRCQKIKSENLSTERWFISRTMDLHNIGGRKKTTRSMPKKCKCRKGGKRMENKQVTKKCGKRKRDGKNIYEDDSKRSLSECKKRTERRKQRNTKNS